MRKIWEAYFAYLIHLCNLEKPFKEWENVFRQLHDINFIYVIERDENRAIDGAELRDEFVRLELTQYPYGRIIEEFFTRPCTVFEMLVALAIRIEGEFIGDPSDEHPERIFMEMLKNLGLKPGSPTKYVKETIDRWMDRFFYTNGVGGIFPLKHSTTNQRHVEIWDQMISYIHENY